MKKILLIALTALMLICAMTVVASAAPGDVATAAPATDYIPAVDGVKDDVYDNSTPIVIGADGDAISGKAYFAYDNEFLYVFFEVKDATVPASASGNITPASHTDAAMICINLRDEACNTSVWNTSSVNENNYWTAIYAAMRTAKNSNQAYEGGHAHLNKGYKATAVSSADGYVAEMVIPFGSDFSGNPYSVADFISKGISVEFAIADADTGTEPIKETEVVWHISSGAEKFKMVQHYPYNSDEAVKMHKLEFIAGEIKANRAEATAPAATTPVITTPAIVTPAIVTPAITTPAATTPVATTPVATTPAETTPAETTPAETTPAETTPAETTPAETTPAATTPAQTTAPVVDTPAESSTPVGLIIGIVVAVLVVAAVVVVVLKKKGNKA